MFALGVKFCTLFSNSRKKNLQVNPNPPEDGEDWPDIFRDVENVIMPGVINIISFLDRI